MGRIPENVIAQIIDRADIVDIISQYVPLKKAGRNFKGLSPFKHEKTASFIVSPDKQIFHCFSTGTGGNIIGFVMHVEHLTFPEAVRFLAAKVNVIIEEDPREQQNISERRQIFDVNRLALEFFHQTLLSDKSPLVTAARDYLTKRGFEVETAKMFQLGFAPDQWDGLINHLKDKGVALRLMEKAGLIIPRDGKEGYYDRFRGRIMFPIFDTQGNCRAFGGRVMKAEEGGAKYMNSPETPVYTKGQHLYGFQLAKNFIAKDDFIVVVEGYVDCIMPYQSGVQNVVAALGTALTVEQVRLIRRYTKNVCMLFDADKAGQDAVLRSLDILVEEGMQVKVAALEEGEDPDSFIRKYGPQKFVERLLKAGTLFDFKLNKLMKKHDAKSVEGKAKIITEMLLTIAKYDHAVIQAGYVQQLSGALQVPQPAIMAELKKTAAPKESHIVNNLPEVVAFKREQLRAVETNLLRLILEEEQFIQKVRQGTDLSDFQDGNIRRVISKIYSLFDQGQKVTFGSLLNSLEDEPSQQLVTALIEEESTLVENKEKICLDCVNRIRQDRVKAQRQELLRQIKEAEQKGDHNELDMLKAKFSALISNLGFK